MSEELSKALMLNDSKTKKEWSEHSLSNVEEAPTYNKNLIDWRRAKALEYYSRGHSQKEIADILQVSTGTISEDLKHVFDTALHDKEATSKKLFIETQKSLRALDMLSVILWQSLESTNDTSERLSLTFQLTAIINQRLEIVSGKHSITKRTLRQM